MIMHNAPMKKIILVSLLLAPIALTGCHFVKTHNPFRHKESAYKSAQQVQPLEVPPGMDQPPTAEALTIPNAGPGGASSPAESTASSATGTPSMAGAESAASTATGSSLTLADTPDSAYRRVGLALARGDVGRVTARDDANHSYQIAVDTVVTHKPQGGFFHRLFHRSHSETVKGTVTVSVTPSGTGSLVSAQGDPDAVQRVMSMLQERLGGG
jgi:uncharacterized lipoprotein